MRVFPVVLALLFGTLIVAGSVAASGVGSPYFPSRGRTVLEYAGTYEFKYRRVEMAPSPGGSYVVRSSGDQTESSDTLVSRGGYTYWVLGSSGERWLKVKNVLRSGQTWQQKLLGQTHTYRVEAMGLTIKVPAGTFRNCAKLSESWITREHDAGGRQRVELYLAPSVGILKRVVRSGGRVEHKEVAVSYRVLPLDG